MPTRIPPTTPLAYAKACANGPVRVITASRNLCTHIFELTPEHWIVAVRSGHDSCVDLFWPLLDPDWVQFGWEHDEYYGRHYFHYGPDLDAAGDPADQWPTAP